MPAANLPARLTIATLMLLLAASLTYSMHPVHAQSKSHTNESKEDEPLDFRLAEVGPRTGLIVYSASEHNVYVYQNVTEGNTHINCAYSLHLTRPSGPVERRNCPAGAAY